MLNTWSNTVKEGLSRLRNDGHEDFTVICGDQSFKVHSCVLSMHSPVFARMCHGPFKETITKVIDLSDDDMSCVQAMIDFLYSSDCDTTSSLQMPGKLCIFADKWCMPHLKDLAEEKFEGEVVEHINTHFGGEFFDAVAEVGKILYDAPEATKELRKMLADCSISDYHWDAEPERFHDLIKDKLYGFDLAAAVKESYEAKLKRMKRKAKSCIICGYQGQS